MFHYIFNADILLHVPRSEIADGMAELVVDYTVPDSNWRKLPSPLDDYECCSSSIGPGTLLSVVRNGQRNLAVFGVCADVEKSSSMYFALESRYFAFTEEPQNIGLDWACPHIPKNVPWCAVVQLHIDDDEAEWLNDFVRCLAWVFVGVSSS